MMLYAICYVNSMKVLILIPITLHAEFLDLSDPPWHLSEPKSPEPIDSPAPHQGDGKPEITKKIPNGVKMGQTSSPANYWDMLGTK